MFGAESIEEATVLCELYLGRLASWVAVTLAEGIEGALL